MIRTVHTNFWMSNSSVYMRPKHIYAQAYWINHRDVLVSQVSNTGQNLHMTGYGIIYRVVFRTKKEKLVAPNTKNISIINTININLFITMVKLICIYPIIYIRYSIFRKPI